MNKKSVLLLFCVFFISILPKDIYATNYIKFNNISVENGLSQGTVETIVQDNKGYIWMGTNDGLNRYNGKDIEVFKHSMEDSDNTILSNYIISLEKDNKNNLWIGTDKGISKMDLSDYSIKNYNYIKDNKEKQTIILYVYVNKDNKVYIGTYYGIYVYDEKNDDFSEVGNVNSKLNNKSVYCIEEDNEGNLWIGTKNGLSKLNTKTNELTQININNMDTSTWGRINTITFDNKNNVWIGTENNGLKIINLKTKEIKSYQAEQNNLEKLQSNTIRKILVDSMNNIWIGTEYGLSKYDGKDKFTTYGHKAYDNTSLESNIIYDIYEDESGLIWVGNLTGISTFDATNKIENYKNTSDENSISSNVIFGIHEDEDELLWVGTRDNGLNIIDRKNDTVETISKGITDYDLSSDAISFVTGKGNFIWVGTTRGVNRIDKRTKKIEKYTTEDGLTDNNIKNLLIDSENNLWIGTAGGLSVLDIDKNTITNMTQRLIDEGMENPYIQELYEDEDGIIWMGGSSTRGMITYDKKNDVMKISMNYKNEKTGESIEIDTVRHIIQDKNGTFWIGTNSGLITCDKNGDNFKLYTERDGLSNNVIYQILLDEEGKLWMSTNNGICIFDVENKTFKKLTASDGLQGNEFDTNSAYKCKNGDFAFGGARGLSIFNPKEISQNNYVGKVNFNGFEVMGNDYLDIDEQTFKYNQNFIKFEYFLSDYKNVKDIQYYYKLDGINSSWVKTNNNETIFNDLAPGTYTFRIKAENSSGIMSEENIVKFTIKPPIWKSDTAFLIYTIIIILFIYRYINKMKMLDFMVEKRTKQLYKEMKKNENLFNKVIDAERKKNNYFINLSHELRTPLNVLNSIEQLITSYCNSDKEMPKIKLADYMNIMKSNTNRLMNLINNILDTSKIENGKYIINKEPCDIVYLVEETALSLKDSIEASNIELIVDTDVEEKIINCDKGDIEKCILNLVSNAQKFTPPGGRISIDIEDIDQYVKITVSDTGIGIDEKYHESIFDRFNQIVDEYGESRNGTGLGLTITKQIIDLHEGQITLKSEKDKGSKFTIILPA